MKLGFTGRRRGITPEQENSLRIALATLQPDELHHGASPIAECADWIAEASANILDIPVVRHPPRYPANSFNLLRRNKEIVAAVDQLLACPATTYEVRRSGTWATVRYARAANIPVTIIQPNGRLFSD